MSMRFSRRRCSTSTWLNPDVIVTANPGCMLQLRAGAKMHGRNQPVKHVVEVLDEAYGGVDTVKT